MLKVFSSILDNEKKKILYSYFQNHNNFLFNKDFFVLMPKKSNFSYFFYNILKLILVFCIDFFIHDISFLRQIFPKWEKAVQKYLYSTFNSLLRFILIILDSDSMSFHKYFYNFFSRRLLQLTNNFSINEYVIISNNRFDLLFNINYNFLLSIIKGLTRSISPFIDYDIDLNYFISHYSLRSIFTNLLNSSIYLRIFFFNRLLKKNILKLQNRCMIYYKKIYIIILFFQNIVQMIKTFYIII